jgi:ATP-dependent Clp protease ATP-binding subunit ClpA
LIHAFVVPNLAFGIKEYRIVEKNKNKPWDFLLDAEKTFQYGVFSQGKNNESPVYGVAFQEGADGNFQNMKFKPHQRVFAFSDASELVFDRNTGTRLQVKAYQIDMGPKGEFGQPVLSVGVDYAVNYIQEEGKDATVIYLMTPESQVKLGDLNFGQAFPVRFQTKVSEPLGELAQNDPGAVQDLLDRLPFPPQHKYHQAHAAREKITDHNAPPHGVTLPALAGAFNTSSSRAIPPPPKNPEISDEDLRKAIREYCTDLTALAISGKLDPVVGRNDEIQSALNTLFSYDQSCVCFTGDAGVGKTTMFHGVAQYLADGKAPPDLPRVRVIQWDISAMSAGPEAKWRGSVEGKIRVLSQGLMERGGYFEGQKIITCVDEIHSQLASGKTEGGANAGNMLKPFLASRGIAVMGATTTKEYQKYIASDGGLADRFEEQPLRAPDRSLTMLMLKSVAPRIREHHALEKDITTEQLQYIIDMTDLYVTGKAQPRKARKVLVRAASAAELRGSKVIEMDDIYTVLAPMAKVDKAFFGTGHYDQYLALKQGFKTTILGQDLGAVADRIGGARAGLGNPDKPLAAFLFLGPTGVGKTETALEIARTFMGSKAAMLRIDMSDYKEAHTVSRLVGAPPGYIGHDGGAVLLDHVRKHPYTVVLLDEIEKAHPDVQKMFLGVLDHGEMTDPKGNVVSFKNVIFVMTSNMGSGQVAQLQQNDKKKVGFQQGVEQEERHARQLTDASDKAFKAAPQQFLLPELMGRMKALGGDPVVFKQLSKDIIRQLVDRQLDKTAQRLAASSPGMENVTLMFPLELRQLLTEKAYDPSINARAVESTVNKVNDLLGLCLLNPKNKSELMDFVKEHGGAKLMVDLVGEDISLRFEAPDAVAPVVQVVAPPSNDNPAGVASSRPVPVSGGMKL